MKIENLDSNFAIPNIRGLNDIEWFDIRQEPFIVYGVQFDDDNGEVRRIPSALCEGMRPQVTELAAHTAGGRIRFITDSPYVAITCVTKNEGLVNRFTIAGAYGCSIYSGDKFGLSSNVKCHTLTTPFSFSSELVMYSL